MIIRSLDRIHLNNYTVDTIVYPEFKSGNLVSMIVQCISRYIYKAREVASAELKKGDPSKIEFDYNAFYRQLNEGKIDVPDFVDEDYIEDMLRRARTAPSFSLRKYIRPTILRNFVTNFYNMEQGVPAVASAGTILVVDDFGTTGTTIREIIRNIREINTNCEIYVFTLMGNKRRK